jgi:sulfite exporter TauE/SafE
LSNEITMLAITAASLGFIHTVIGPDHYIPFAAMAKARKWNLSKTLWITFLCGIGHVGSSVLIGLIGIALGLVVGRLEIVESFRGNLAAWAMIAFGLVYGVWGLRQALRGKEHRHFHSHADLAGHEHEHRHTPDEGHMHVHEEPGKPSITPWVLFTVFVFGPCEPLIPLLMYPAVKHSTGGMLLVSLVFAAATIGTMLVTVGVTTLGFKALPLGKLERYSHALAGATIMACGLAIQFLGL